MVATSVSNTTSIQVRLVPKITLSEQCNSRRARGPDKIKTQSDGFISAGFGILRINHMGWINWSTRLDGTLTAPDSALSYNPPPSPRGG